MRITKLLCFLTAFVVGNHAAAADWQVSSASGDPGSAVPIVVKLSGDGETVLAGLELVFDGSKLLLPVESGPIPGASNNGAICQRASLNRINILLLSDAQTPIPAGPIVMCKLPFTLAKPQGRGRTAITAQNPECFDKTRPVERCTAQSGAVIVNGPPRPQPVASPVLEREIHILLANDPRAPTVEQIADFDFSSDRPRLLAALAVESPFDADALIKPRATGDFLGYLKTYPETARAKLERYAVVRYKADANVERALTALRAERYVKMAYAVQLDPEPRPKQQPQAAPEVAQLGPVAKSTANQYHLNALNIPGLWQRAGGWALVGVIDSGLEVNHPNLRSFTGAGSLSGTYTSGNFLPIYSRDFRYDVDNVDERRLVPVQVDPNPDLTALYQECDLLDGADDNFMTPTAAGHGTHVSGLIASKTSPNNDMTGVCKYCPIGMGKITEYSCISVVPRLITPLPKPASTISAFSFFNGVGAQVINFSFGIRVFAYEGNCQTPPPPALPPNSETALCLAVQFANENDIVLVGASGNNREPIQFPAEDPRVVAVGGLGVDFTLWDESPGIPVNTDTCPRTPESGECGSNFTMLSTDRKQELAVPAKSVRSTVYTGIDYNGEYDCGDAFGGAPANDGAGNCTGTSMSAPQVAGIFGILRSINPLLATGDPESIVNFGLRNLVVNNTLKAQQNLPWTHTLGYGRPDPRGPADSILGTVRSEILKNRPIPLFGFYSPGASDYAAVATPQTAMALARYSSAAYQSIPSPPGSFIGGSTIAQYTFFPHEVGTPSPTPIAIAYVLSTEFTTQLEPNRTVTPLYFLDRARNWPLGCTAPNCNTANRDFILLSSTAHVNSAVATGYRFRGLQGYVFTTQANGSQPLHLKCKTSDDDCAVFLEEKRSQFELVGYTTLFPGASSSILGYAFSAIDSNPDGDSLASGVEYVIGTNPNLPDSDGDKTPDGDEFFINAVSFSDPCSGPVVNCLGVTEAIFANGFE
jgi:serine protease